MYNQALNNKSKEKLLLAVSMSFNVLMEIKWMTMKIKF